MIVKLLTEHHLEFINLIIHEHLCKILYNLKFISRGREFFPLRVVLNGMKITFTI